MKKIKSILMYSYYTWAAFIVLALPVVTLVAIGEILLSALKAFWDDFLYNFERLLDDMKRVRISRERYEQSLEKYQKQERPYAPNRKDDV